MLRVTDTGQDFASAADRILSSPEGKLPSLSTDVSGICMDAGFPAFP